MKLIAHRGNLKGKNPKYENHPDYILDAVWAGFDVEVDVWNVKGQWFLGHDAPTYSIKQGFLENEKLWCHAKNFQSLTHMLNNKNIHSFWHQNDDFTLTSQGYIWTFPGKKLHKNSVAVKPEQFDFKDIEICYAICSDFAGEI